MTLAGLGIEPIGPVELFSQNSTQGREVVFVCSSNVHPETQGFVLDKLTGANGLVYGEALMFSCFGLEL